MVLLEKGQIGVFQNQGIAIKDRIKLSSGLESVNNLNLENYYPNAHIPIGPWRGIRKVELDRLIINSTVAHRSHVVSLIKLPTEVMKNVHDLLPLSAITSAQDMDRMIGENMDNYKQALYGMLEYLSEYYLDEDSIELHHFTYFPKGYHTLTKDPDKGYKLIGMHFDNWDKAKIKEREKARNRICVNLGKESRYLLFANYSLNDMLCKLENDFGFTLLSSDDPLLKIREAYFTHFQDYPIIKLEVKPGEAYIAPTENILHDGSSLDKTYDDMHFTIRGNFSYH